MILAQITTTPVDSVALEQGTETIRIIDLLFKGGFMMVPLILLSIVAVYIFVERILTIKKASQTPGHFTDKIRQLVGDGDIGGAKLLCTQTDTPIARMIEKGISSTRP